MTLDQGLSVATADSDAETPPVAQGDGTGLPRPRLPRLATILSSTAAAFVLGASFVAGFHATGGEDALAGSMGSGHPSSESLAATPVDALRFAMEPSEIPGAALSPARVSALAAEMRSDAVEATDGGDAASGADMMRTAGGTRAIEASRRASSGPRRAGREHQPRRAPGLMLTDALAILGRADVPQPSPQAGTSLVEMRTDRPPATKRGRLERVFRVTGFSGTKGGRLEREARTAPRFIRPSRERVAALSQRIVADGAASEARSRIRFTRPAPGTWNAPQGAHDDTRRIATRSGVTFHRPTEPVAMAGVASDAAFGTNRGATRGPGPDAGTDIAVDVANLAPTTKALYRPDDATRLARLDRAMAGFGPSAAEAAKRDLLARLGPGVPRVFAAMPDTAPAPLMVARTRTGTVGGTLLSAFAPVSKDFAKRSRFDALLARPGTSAFVPPVSKSDHVWAARPLPASVREAGELRCLAEGIYFESRGETKAGQAAVAQVILNRVRAPAFPGSICAVVYQNQAWRNRCQFSFACDGIPERIHSKRHWRIAKDIARAAVEGRVWFADIGSSTHYHATYVNPRWNRGMERVARIGRHIFYRTRTGAWD